MSAVAVLGAGRVGILLATSLARAGHDVTLGARRPEAVPPADANDATVLDVTNLSSAAGCAPVVINALPGSVSLEVLASLRDVLAGRVLLDVSNATTDDDHGGPGALLYPGSSLAAHLQAALPDTAVVKSLNTMLFLVMTNPNVLGNTPHRSCPVTMPTPRPQWSLCCRHWAGPPSSSSTSAVSAPPALRRR